MAERMEVEGKKSSLSTFLSCREESEENSLVGIVMKQILEIL